MGKKKKELNGVLVYRRWCAGAILSIFILALVIAAPVFAVVFNWFTIKVPDGSTVAADFAGKTIRTIGLDSTPAVIGQFLKRFGFQTSEVGSFVSAIGGSTTVRFFSLLSKVMMIALFVLLCFIVLFIIIEFFFFLFYLFTGRVVSPVSPVKISWVLFVLLGLWAGATFGYTFFLNLGYVGAGASTPLQVNFFWPIYYVGASFIAALLLSIVYNVSFKDKFYIGRAKRFGSGEVNGAPAGQPTYQIVTPGGTTTAQPSVIVVNSNPYPTAQPIIQTVPAQPQNGEFARQNPSGEPANVAKASANIPSDVKSIGGHAYAKNTDLKYADIPLGIKELGVGAFANCINLEIVSIPKSVRRIKKNCFFNCVSLVRINYAGTKAEWRYIVRGSNWLEKAGTRTVVCSDGAIIVDPHR